MNKTISERLHESRNNYLNLEKIQMLNKQIQLIEQLNSTNDKQISKYQDRLDAENDIKVRNNN